jgi:hypothetical protein
MTTLSKIIRKLLLGSFVKIKNSSSPDDWFLVIGIEEPHNSDGYNGCYVQQFRLHLKDSYQEIVTIGMSDEIEIRA